MNRDLIEFLKEQERERKAERDRMKEEMLDDQLETMQHIFNTSL